jgi:hypothetical protein
LRWPCDTLYQQKVALTSPTNGGRSDGIVRSLRTKATEFFVYQKWEQVKSIYSTNDDTSYIV